MGTHETFPGHERRVVNLNISPPLRRVKSTRRFLLDRFLHKYFVADRDRTCRSSSCKAKISNSAVNEGSSILTLPEIVHRGKILHEIRAKWSSWVLIKFDSFLLFLLRKIKKRRGGRHYTTSVISMVFFLYIFWIEMHRVRLSRSFVGFWKKKDERCIRACVGLTQFLGRNACP